MRAQKIMYSDGTMVNLEMTVDEYRLLRYMAYYAAFQQDRHYKHKERKAIVDSMPTLHGMEH